MKFQILNSFIVVFSFCAILQCIYANASEDVDVKVFTVASDITEGYQRYIRSAKYYNVEVETLGLGEKWLGGDMDSYGGGYKLNLLKAALEPFKDDDKKIILFTDSYDVLFTSGLDVIVEKFKDSGARVLFGAEHFCWPDESVQHLYPYVKGALPKYLNSGLYIGYASDVYEILGSPVKDTDDDQLYFTRKFLDQETREKHKIKLDYTSELFQNLNGASGDVRVEYDQTTGEYLVRNLVSDTVPSILHGNGPSKVLLNNFGSYVAGAFRHKECQLCKENKLELTDDENLLPTVTIGIFIESPMPFMEEFFDSILALEYPKNKISIFIHNNVQYHRDLVAKFTETYGPEYANIKQIYFKDKFSESAARNLAVNYAEQQNTDYLFVVDAEAHIDNTKTLLELIKQDKNIIAPLMTRHGETWSNYWGSLSELGFYARSHDYMKIVKNNIRGLWNVPFISSCYLVKKEIFPKMTYADDKLDPDMALCKNLREQGIFMYVYNTEHFGHLVNGEDFNPMLTRPDFYMLLSNRFDWENRYINPNYYDYLKPNVTFIQPCPDVYWFPIVNERFCHDFVAINEAYGKWSDGSNSDERLQGGYEAVPTRDIHMNQVGLDPLWLKFLELFVRPIQEAVFTGYYHNPPKSMMNFIVRYRPDEQPELRPHHDSSTYTINIALNRAGIDYEGGGCRFIRYNCSVTDTKMGWMLIHPGRLTHFHEGLRVTKGTRYIMVSFVDP